jgi:hypothetical protein
VEHIYHIFEVLADGTTLSKAGANSEDEALEKLDLLAKICANDMRLVDLRSEKVIASRQRRAKSDGSRVPKYDIFSGRFGDGAFWLEAVEGFAAAHERMKQLAAESPGAYFLFCRTTHTVEAAIDTTAAAGARERRKATNQRPPAS